MSLSVVSRDCRDFRGFFGFGAELGGSSDCSRGSESCFIGFNCFFVFSRSSASACSPTRDQFPL